MRSSSLYFANLSVSDKEPVFIWPVPKPATKWAIDTPSVSLDLWEIIELQLACFAKSMAFIVSESEPIWFSLIKIAFAEFFWMPFFKSLY